MEDFKNRLLKLEKHIGKWARRQGITCYRIYDKDIPEYPLSVDRYQDYLYISLYEKNYNEEIITDEWVAQILEATASALQTAPEKIVLRARKQQKGLEQYEKVDSAGNRMVVMEDGLQFIVNLTDYLDTGLFLDHRNTRKMVRGMSDNARFLNLFAYTGSFTVYAAAGGATNTTTVDLSNTYLEWAKENMTLNGFIRSETKAHHFVRTDVVTYLQRLKSGSFDMIVMDPPTFSNSKRMSGVLDIQRDHVDLINSALRVLSPGGTLIFSTNYRGFKLNEADIKSENIKNISTQSVPDDFRNKKIHQCFVMVG
ncbi:MAG: class I SAM-dependent methyltransferase [Saprospiraceae bacterium]|nr:class I SAM-dependent methyltransferase [Saprospiraceae bacterium]